MHYRGWPVLHVQWESSGSKGALSTLLLAEMPCGSLVPSETLSPCPPFFRVGNRGSCCVVLIPRACCTQKVPFTANNKFYSPKALFDYDGHGLADLQEAGMDDGSTVSDAPDTDGIVAMARRVLEL